MSPPLFSPPYGFLGLEPERSRLETSRFVVLPVPYEQTTTFGGGTRSGPEAILRASREVELWDDELGAEPAEMGIHTRPALEPSASGPVEMVDRIRRAVCDLDHNGRIPVLLGGEHTVSVGAVQAIVDRRPDLVAVVLDAHADLRNEYQGSPLSHACAARRISEQCPIVQIGIRSMSKEESGFAGDESGGFFSMGRIRSDSDWMGEMISRVSGKRVYLSIDLDVLDPGIMPSVGTPEPGGLGWYEITLITAEIAKSAEVVAFDVVELAPIPGLIAPDFLAARLVYKVMGQIAGEL
ncbi:MAG: agmatinase [Candidatus Eisenbacteria sp.]|nr:agmatinase [Candidatus Eisenbacteria bacterium]